MNLSIRPAFAGDEQVLARLNKSLHDVHFGERPDFYRAFDSVKIEAWFSEFLAREDAKAWIAEVDGTPAGYLSAIKCEREANAFCAERKLLEIDHISVEPEYRCRGVGK